MPLDKDYILARPSRADNLATWLRQCGTSTIPFHFEYQGLHIGQAEP